MFKSSVLLIILIFLFTNSNAQTPVKLGIGVSTNFSATNTGYQNAAKISLDFGNLRFEPFVAVVKSKQKREPDPNSNNSFDTDSQQSLLLGSNFIFLVQNEKSHLYFGAGIGYEKITYSNEYKSGSSFGNYDYERSGLVLIPTIGGEYFLSSEFSFGVEINYQILNLSGSSTETGNNQSTYRAKNTYEVSTIGAYFTARYYLN